MEERRKDARREPVIVDLEALVPEDHLLRKIERVMDYEWQYALLSPYYCHDNGRPGIDPVVLIKMVLIQHLFGIASLRQTYREIQVSFAGRSMQSAKSWGRSRSRRKTMATTIRRIPAAERQQKRRSPQQTRTAECS